MNGRDGQSADDIVRATVLVSGRVQGVGYRSFVASEAVRCGLGGYANNLRDGRVQVQLEGSRAMVELVIDQLRSGPPAARVEAVDVRYQPTREVTRTFSSG